MVVIFNCCLTLKGTFMKKLLAVLLAGSALVACSSNKAPAQAPVASAPVVPASAPVVEASEPVATVTNHNSVYYAFDKYDIKDEYAGIVKANATFLAANPHAKVQVQGNTDDIGSVEYNLSLGQKRADAVKKALVATGAAKAQVEATSNGKTKPKYDNNSDDSRAKNRRADILYVGSDKPAGYSTDSDSLPVVDSSFYNGTVSQGVQ
jgi:peptidoglycan-associated lipoprotein